MPSAALGKGFAEGKVAFTECIMHSAKRLNPVVLVPGLIILQRIGMWFAEHARMVKTQSSVLNPYVYSRSR